MKKLFLTTTAFFLVAGPLASSVFAEETDVQKLEAQLSSELQKVNTKYQEIESLNQQIESLHKEKETLSEKVKTQEAKVEERKVVASKRLQLMQISDLATYSILHLLNSESISDFLNRLFVFQQFFQSDEEVLKSLADQVNELNRLKTEASQAQSDLETKKEKLTSESQSYQSSIEGLKQLIADNKATFEKMEKEKKEAKVAFSPTIAALTSDSKQTNQVAPSTSSQDTTAAKPVAAEPSTSTTQAAPTTTETPTTTSNSSSSSQSSGRTLQVVATGYSYNEPGLGYYTATGIDLRSNPTVIAVDPSVIPLGSLIEVPGYGVAIAGDTGSAIKGNKIDLHFVSVDQANQWGRRTVTIKILK